MFHRVHLEPDQLRIAAREGIERRIRAISGHMRGKNGWCEPIEWQTDVQGAIGEFVIATAFAMPWDGRGAIGGTDVGGMQVRTTTYATGHLPLQLDDSDAHLFWLVTGKDADYVIRGCIRGCDGKRYPFHALGKHDRPCHWVPQHALQWPAWAIERVRHGRSTNGLQPSL